ncbi:hypothetical protein XU18_4009 [Perkinsela sp. CCAP 1560/4]|nr:hypothetical protein XU18_4009 [Perkinsela sp. CCAP 1560/4]|eukprot:KNH04821.1 hypothetical protein XU18_4009 [Perkinsela sp. CCAP 1560/4]
MCIRVERRVQIEQSVKCCSIKSHLKIKKQNSRTGTADLGCLPPAMTDFRFLENKFAGSVELRKLSLSLRNLEAHKNESTGNACLTELPSGLTYLNLSENRFSTQRLLATS